MYRHEDVSSANLKELFPAERITKLEPILLSQEDATNMLVAFNGQVVKAVWNTKDTGSYFILIDGESIATVRIKGDK